MRKVIGKLCCVVCAVGTYIMAFMTSEMFRRNIPMDIPGGIALAVCNAAVLYLFIRYGDEMLNDTDEPEGSGTEARDFCSDFYDTFFTEGEK